MNIARNDCLPFTFARPSLIAYGKEISLDLLVINIKFVNS